ncbi:acyltransferase family protein [Flavobacterium sp. ZT3R17]|uniref:acyltransferase family protein n=1 Tax=Flavobacterium cryoconiti TaxID=3398736 RepID=UPI003A88096C
MKISQFLNKDNNNLDLARIILACLVIVGHSEAINGSGIYWIDPIEHFFKFTYSGAFAVKLFFFISGLVVTNSYLSKKSAIYFVISRIFRIIPALLFVLLVTVFIFGLALTKFEVLDYLSKLDYLIYIRRNLVFYSYYLLPGVFNENLYPNIVNGSFWSLRYEVACYIVLLILFIILGKRNKYYIIIIIIPIVLIFIDTLLPTRFLLSFIDNNPEKYLLPISFAYGAFLAVLSDKVMIGIYTVIFSILAFIAFKNTSFADFVFLFASCNILVYLSSRSFVLKLKPKYDISYGIYLWGFLIQQTIVHYLGHIYIGFHCVIAIIISVLLALLTFVFIEKPFIKKGKFVIDYIGRNMLKNTLIYEQKSIKE